MPSHHLTPTITASNACVDAALAARIARDDVEHFSAHVRACETLYAACASGACAWTHSANAARATKAFATSRARVREDDFTRILDVSLRFVHACVDVDDACAGEWCDAAIRAIDAYGKHRKGTSASRARPSARCDWRGMFARAERFFKGDARAYAGYGVSGSTHLMYIKLVRKCRRFFEDGAAREIWARVAEACQSTDHNACFEALATCHAFMPCMHVGNHGSDDAAFFVDVVRGEWCAMFDALGANAHWKAYWMSMFAQLAKHDVAGEIVWTDGVFRGILTATLSALELPIGGVEGRVPFGRKLPGRAAAVFQSSRDAPAVRSCAKFLTHRSTAAADARATTAIAQIVDYIEHYYHPSNSGYYVGNLMSFMRFCIKYTEKLVHARDGWDVEAVERFATTMKRLTDRGMFSKNSTLRQASMVATSRLAYMCPRVILPTVLMRFEEALSHETATRRLVPALNCLTACVRPLLQLPLNTIFEDSDGEAYMNVNEFIASALMAALPGIDVNDSSKTCAALRLFCATVSNVTALVDVGEPGANPLVPIMWSEWTIQFLSQLFVLFEHLQPDTHGSKSDAADAFKGGARDASGFLLGSTSMYQPFLRLLFARLDPDIRKLAVNRVAAFVRENTLPELVDEVGVLVQAATMADPETSVEEILRPLARALREDISTADATLSTAVESRIRWNSGLLIMGAHRAARSVASALTVEIKALSRDIFSACETNGNMELLDTGEHILSMLVSGLTTTYMVDEEQDVLGEDGVADWVTTRWEVDDGEESTVGARHAPTPFQWSYPTADNIREAEAIVDEFLTQPANALIQGTNDGGAGNVDVMDIDGGATLSSSKKVVRVRVSAIGGVLTGFRVRLADFSDPTATKTFLAHREPVIASAEARGLAAQALVAAVSRTSADDVETLRLICSVADVVLNPHAHAFSARSAGFEALRSDATYLSQPQSFGVESRSPRWLVAENVRLNTQWRDAMSTFYSGSSSEFNDYGPVSDPRRVELLRMVEELALSKYSTVRRSALPVVDTMFERYPSDAHRFVQRSIDALAHTEENEDACIAACYALRCSTTLTAVLHNEALFAPFVRAVLGSAHHGSEKAQASVGSLFLHYALLFTRGAFARACDGIQMLKLDMLSTLESSYESSTTTKPMHWSYEMMTNAMTVFFLDPRLDEAAFLTRATRVFMQSTLGDLKVTRFPAMCALLMLSRYDCYESTCVPEIREIVRTDAVGTVRKWTRNFALAHSALDAGEARSQVNGKADALMQAAESLYGFANEMSGPDWPMTRAFECLPSTGAFIVAVARFWMLLARVAPDDVVTGLRAFLDDPTIQNGDRSMRCAVAEALAGTLASRAVANVEDERWMERAFIKFALDASTDQREEWLRGAAYCTDSGNGNISDSLLRRLLEHEESLSTVTHVARSLELKRVCAAQLGRAGGLDIKHAMLDALADPVRTPIFHESRIVREHAAQLAALMIASAEPELAEPRARVVELFTRDIERAASQALSADPAMPDPELTKARDAIEGVFYAALELVRRGDGAAIAPSASAILRAALRTAESKDKDFAMIAKLTVAYLKYVRFEDDVLRQLTHMLIATLHDTNWHTRAATLRFIQALAYGHAFALGVELFIALRDAVVASLSDKQLEVAQLASSTLMIFLKGVGASSEAELRATFLRVAKTTPVGADADPLTSSTKHAAVLGLSACVLAHPYDVPTWMPEVMETLGFASLEPAPMKLAAQKTFAEFKKTHQDTWSETRAAFTHDQWDAVTLGLDLAPSYII
mmetsp:Transcript_9211/g.30419  ORF Transcript_9211/g.30419 Transcript_9211/m.30419 type:complete len:1774 (+) Transcript_9211:120-5441(+)